MTVQVPSNATEYDAAVDALEAAGLASSNRKYLVYADWNVSGLCGVGTYYGDEDPSSSNYNNTEGGHAFTYLSCWDWNTSRTALHELFHNLGAVQTNAPNGNGGHCIDGTLSGSDIMCYGSGSFDACDAAGPRIMDCGRDDYFNVSPVAGSYLANNWNPANSSYLVAASGCAPQDNFAKSYPIGGNRGWVKGSNAGCGVEAGEPTEASGEVLDADTVAWFKRNGGLQRANGDRFRAMVLSRGGSAEAMDLYRAFRGGAPELQPLLERRGLEAPTTNGRRGPSRARNSVPRSASSRKAQLDPTEGNEENEA